MTITVLRTFYHSLPDGEAYVDITYDAPDLALYEGAIVSIHIVNTSPTKSVTIVLDRPNNVNWVTLAIPPNSDRTIVPAGNVQNVEDIPHLAFGTTI